MGTMLSMRRPKRPGGPAVCDNDRETDAVAAAWAGVVKPAARALWGYLREHNWPVVMLVWAPVVMLAYCGVVARWPDMGLLDRIYLIVQLLPVQASFEGAGRLPWSLEIARFALPLLTVTTPLVFVFGRWVRLWRIRLIGGHVIVCGAGEKGLALVRSLRARRRAVVVIELDAEGDLLKPCRDAGAVVLVGDATGERVLRRAGAASARRLVAVTPQDDTNVEISNQARAIRARSRRAEPLTCVIQVLDTRFCHDLAGWAFAEGTTGRFELELFNIYRDGAKQLLKDPPPFSEQPAAQHVLVVGTGRMAAAVVERVAWEWLRRERERHGGAGCAAPFWDWLGRRREQGAQCRITLVGPAATAGSSLLLAQHGWVGRCCALVGRDMAVPSAEFEQGAFLPVVEKTSSAYVCLEDGEASFVAGNTLLRLLDGGKVPVTVVVERAFGVAACGTGIRDFPAVFALLDRTCDAGLLERGAVETVARALHDEWRRRPAIPEPPCWEHAPGYMRESSRAAVRSLRDSLAGLGFRLGPLTDLQHADVRFSKAEVEAMARGEHERWFEERDADGWTWARTYDREKRTSPWLRQWDNKDYT
ncbi:hypothetical protein FJY71_06565, partial [candidate division WOR-3 bacterium]|nr:hypothetical protein [candidate division WOR-3 bacterium]